MAFGAQYLEGMCALYQSMHIFIGRPALYCDTRAAGLLAAGSGEWRTKALVNRVIVVQPLIHLGALTVSFVPTDRTQSDLLTKFMGKQTLQKQRAMIGCEPVRTHSASEGAGASARGAHARGAHGITAWWRTWPPW